MEDPHAGRQGIAGRGGAQSAATPAISDDARSDLILTAEYAGPSRGHELLVWIVCDPKHDVSEFELSENRMAQPLTPRRSRRDLRACFAVIEWQSDVMDYLPHFHREIQAFQTATRRAADADEAALVPSCPGWSVSDLILHLGRVHRHVTRVIGDRLTERPDIADLGFLGLPADHEGWPTPEQAPNRGPIPAGLVDWFAEGASALEVQFRSTSPGEAMWTWSRERTAGFWLRTQTIEAAVHRWDAENAIGTAQPVEAELAADAIGQNFEVMAPTRRAWKQAPPGSGERFRFRQTDGANDWTVCFDSDDVRLVEVAEPCDVESAGTASDLMLFLWQRIPAGRLDVSGDESVLNRYFTLVPPL